MNIIENSKKAIGQAVSEAFLKAVKKGTLAPEGVVDIEGLMHLEVPKDKQHGDFACNIAMLLAKELRLPPRKIAEAIAAEINETNEIEKIEVAGAGFINFYLSSSQPSAKPTVLRLTTRSTRLPYISRTRPRVKSSLAA